MISRVEYASCYVYSPAGAGDVCHRSRLLRDFLKAGDESFLFRYAIRVSQQVKESAPLRGFIGESDVLVPVPGSAPYVEGHVWAAEHLAAAFLKQGLGYAAWCGLRRVRAVHKSATAARGFRPSVDLHYDSFVIESAMGAPRSIVLVDDVVTKGRTLLAAASKIHEAFPRTRIRAFALLRTMGMTSGVRQLIDPCKGEIQWRAGDAHRSP